MKICIYSGTFNPVHNAHILLVKGILDEFDYDKIIIIPNNIPPHKNQEDIASSEDRINMLRLAFNDERVEISDIEIARGGKSYSYDTVRAIKEKYGIDKKISFLVGTDALMGLRSWHRFEEFTKEVDFVVAQRQDDFNVVTIWVNLNIEGLTCNLSKVPFLDISASDVRSFIRQNNYVDNLIPAPIAGYIKEKNLYKTYNFNEIIGILEDEFKSHIEHSVAVSDFAVELASQHGICENKARIAGILHDCVKYIGIDNIQNLMRENEVDVFDHEISSPRTLHAPIGAHIAKTRFNISDEDILNAIRFHTVGRCDMSLLEKIIFIADKIEPVTREEDFRKKIEPELEKSIDHAICRYFELLSEKLTREGVEISPYTREVFEAIKNNCEATQEIK